MKILLINNITILNATSQLRSQVENDFFISVWHGFDRSPVENVEICRQLNSSISIQLFIGLKTFRNSHNMPATPSPEQVFR